MIGIVRIYQDAYGDNMGARTFCHLSKYFGGVLITNNKKIHALTEYKSITHEDAIANRKKFTKLIVYNSKPNMFGGVAPKHIGHVIRLILSVDQLYFYNCDPMLDLQISVPDSHERAAPGLSRAIERLNYAGKKLDRTNTDLTLYLAAQIQHAIVKHLEVNKDFVGVYFGNFRNEKRAEQVNRLLTPLKSQLVIGHEHPDFPWFYYTPDFYKTMSRAYVTPIIGDAKLHYETGIPSLRLYETWHSTTIGLIDARLGFDVGLDKRFYFSTWDDFHKKAKMISENPEVYFSMLNKQYKLLKDLKKKYHKAKYNWKRVLKEKKLAAKKQRLEEKELRKKKRLKTQTRLNQNKSHIN